MAKRNTDFYNFLKAEGVYDFIIETYFPIALKDVPDTDLHPTYFGKYQRGLITFAFTSFGTVDTNEFEKEKSDLKLHYAIDHQDLAQAINVFGNVCSKFDIPIFKVINRQFNNKDQIGKDFTIYFRKEQENPEFLNKFIKEIEHELQSNNIRPAPQLGNNIKSGDKQIKDSNYGFYRYEKINGVETPRCIFKAPENGDVMQDISAKKEQNYVFQCTNAQEALDTVDVLTTFGVECCAKQTVDQVNPQYFVYHNDPDLINDIYDSLQMRSLNNVFACTANSSDDAKSLQYTLNKLAIPTRRFKPITGDENRRIIICPQKNVLTRFMRQLKIDDINKIDAALVDSADEAKQLALFLKKQHILAIPSIFKPHDGDPKYAIVYQRDPLTDRLLHITNAKIIDEKKHNKQPNTCVKLFDKQMG